MDAGTRIQKESTAMMERLDRERMRKIQAEMHRCSAKCCDNTSASMDEVQRCLTNCASPIERVQTFIQGEVENFQGRLSRCVNNCQDELRDKIGSGNSVTPQLQAEGEACVNKCADDFISKLPDLEKRLKENLSRYT